VASHPSQEYKVIGSNPARVVRFLGLYFIGIIFSVTSFVMICTYCAYPIEINVKNMFLQNPVDKVQVTGYRR
jgi:hypothetical protein